MKCKQVRRFLPAYADDEIAGLRRSEIARHLEQCAACRQEFESMKADTELLRQVEAPKPGPFLAVRVLAEVRQSGATRTQSRRPVLVRAFGAAAAVLLVAAGVWVGALVGSGIARSSDATEDEFLNSSGLSFAEFTESVFAEE